MRYRVLVPILNEQERCWFVAAEALAAGRGEVTVVPVIGCLGRGFTIAIPQRHILRALRGTVEAGTGMDVMEEV